MMPIGDYVVNQVESLLNYSDPTNGSITTCNVPFNTQWTWYPTYWCSHTDNRMQTAFKVVKHLMDKKLVKLTTIPQFIDLIDELMTIL